MRRTQMQLTEEQKKLLRQVAADKNVSVSEIIRKAVDEYIRTHLFVDQRELRKRALSAVGKFRSGRKDISEKHDEHLAEIYRR